MSKPWQSLHEIPGQVALLPVWRKHAGEQFQQFRNLCLDDSPRIAEVFPCKLAQSCRFRIIRLPEALTQLPSTLSIQPSTIALGFCSRDPRQCEHIELSEEDTTVLQLNWRKLGRALCAAFELTSNFTEVQSPNTVQIGSWSADATPVLLTIQTIPLMFRRVIAEQVARIKSKFILFAPTGANMDVPCQEMLASVQAGFFPIASNVRLTDHGTLHSIQTPGELFAKFTPQPKDTDLSAAERARAIVSQFDATTYRVFELYCIHELSAAEVATKMKMSKTAIMRRLKAISEKAGLKSKYLRRLSPKPQDKPNETRGETDE